MTPDLIIAITWLACGVLAYGFFVGDMAKEWGQYENLKAERFVGVIFMALGAIGLVHIFISTWLMRGRPFKHGWML